MEAETSEGAGLDISPLVDYVKIRAIGRGDVGKVYLARYKETKKLYAVKVLTKTEMISRNKVKRVLTEREILATADHPFIVTLYKSFQTDERLYFVMEYCAGGELFQLLQRQPGRRVTEEQAQFYTAEVLLALEYLHFMGFVYRDLKPENILVHESGHIRLTDFDLSKQAVGVPTAEVVKHFLKPVGFLEGGQVQFTSFVGTEEYIAPEIIEGKGYSSSVDWWTFGILLYEMLTGTTPFKGGTQSDTFNNIVEGRIRFPETVELSKNAKDIIRKLLHSDGKKRLGHKNGSSDIKKHAFFKGIDWPLVRNMEPPIIPHLKTEVDTSNFRHVPDTRDDFLPRTHSESSLSASEKDPFESFPYEGKRAKDAYGLDSRKPS